VFIAQNNLLYIIKQEIKERSYSRSQVTAVLSISVLNTQRIFNLVLLDGLLVIKLKHPHLKLFYLILRGRPGSKELSNS